MFLVAGVMGGDFGPKGVGMVEVVQMGEFVDNNVVTERFGDVHKTDVERDGAVRGAATPAGGGVAQAAAVVVIAKEFGIIFEAIGEVFLCLLHEDFFLSVASALGFGTAEGDFFADEGAIGI